MNTCFRIFYYKHGPFAGPVPKFFSEEPSKALEELQRSPEFAFGCLQALVAKLVERGELSR